ncbi:MAG: hypothetical protein GIKADHBN_00547 [Phycisphaerales bacterium]|nr:hypothetical protein [Phycisphaerales bacterium]
MLLVDAYNVLHVQGVLPGHLAGIDLDGLSNLISLSRYARARVVLVCDGAPAGGHARPPRQASGLAKSAGAASSHARAAVEIVYAGAGNDADSLIERMLEQDSAARRWTVVSSDHRVRRAAGRAGAQTLDSGAFLRQLAHDEGRPAKAPAPNERQKIPLGQMDVQLWLREFGVDVRAADHAAGRVLEVESTVRPPDMDRSRDRSAKPGSAGSHHRKRPAASEPGADRPSQPLFDSGIRPEHVDPVLMELLAEVQGISLTDLDMKRWLGEIPPPAPPGM